MHVRWQERPQNTKCCCLDLNSDFLSYEGDLLNCSVSIHKCKPLFPFPPVSCWTHTHHWGPCRPQSLHFDSTHIHVSPGDTFKPVTNYSLPPPAAPWTTGASCLRLVGSGLICLSYLTLAVQQCHLSLVSLTDRGSHAVKGEVWSSLQTNVSARYLLCLSASSGPACLPTV